MDDYGKQRKGLEINVEKYTDNILSVCCKGELDIDNFSEVINRLEEGVKNGSKRFVIDLLGVTFIDAAVLGALVGFERDNKQISDWQGVVIVLAPGIVRKVFEMVGLDQTFTLSESRADALSKFG